MRTIRNLYSLLDVISFNIREYININDINVNYNNVNINDIDNLN